MKSENNPHILTSTSTHLSESVSKHSASLTPLLVSGLHLIHLQISKIHPDSDLCSPLCCPISSSLEYCNHLPPGLPALTLCPVHLFSTEQAMILIKDTSVNVLPLIRTLLWLALSHRVKSRGFTKASKILCNRACVVTFLISSPTALTWFTPPCYFSNLPTSSCLRHLHVLLPVRNVPQRWFASSTPSNLYAVSFSVKSSLTLLKAANLSLSHCCFISR